MEEFILQFFDLSHFFTLILLSLSLNLFFIFFRTKFFFSRQANIQNIHLDKFIPRLGGLTIYLIFLYYFIFFSYGDEKSLLFYLLICFIPILITGLLEDLFQNVPPKFRLISMIISTISFFSFYNFNFPLIDLPLIGFLFDFKIFCIIFYSFATISICNGFNFIDGTNGLASMTSICSLGSLLFLSFEVNDVLVGHISLVLMIMLVGFLIFNYPLGKIFLGDLGAYALGFTISILTIVFFGNNPDISPWNAILILFYPIIETIFSFIRKIIYKKSPLLPDENHLHLKLYFLLQDRKVLSQKKKNNNLVMPFLAPVWSFPLLLMPWVYKDIKFIIISMILLTLGYCYYYFLIPKRLK